MPSKYGGLCTYEGLRFTYGAHLLCIIFYFYYRTLNLHPEGQFAAWAVEVELLVLVVVVLQLLLLYCCCYATAAGAAADAATAGASGGRGAATAATAAAYRLYSL